MIEPSIANAIFSGVAPLAVTGLAMAGLRARSAAMASPLERGFHLLLAFSLAPLAWVVASGHSASGAIPLGQSVAGLGLRP